MSTLLPPNASRLERAVETVVVNLLNIDVPVDRLWSAAGCPAELLPYLAWALSVDEWDASWTDERKRAVIAASVEVHRCKGSVGAVRRALIAAGWGSAHILERMGARFHDGSIPRDGSQSRLRADHWAEYRVILDRPITIAQAAAVRLLLATVAPARCHLKALSYTQALYLHDQTVPRTGTYTRGIA